MRTPALYAFIFFAGGILLAVYTDLPALIYFAVVVLATSLALIYFLLHKVILSRILISLAIPAAGAFLTELQTTTFPSNHISNFTTFEKPITVLGSITSEPDIRPTKTFLTVEVESLELDGRKIGSLGKIRLQLLEAANAFNYRDRIRFTGYINQPQTGRNPGAFDYRRYLAIRQIHAIVTLRSAGQVELVSSGSSDLYIRNIVTPVRRYISAVFEEYLSGEQAALIKGFLIGDTRFITQTIYQKFKDTGTLHVLAASGANVGYVVVTITILLRLFRLPKRYRYLLLLIAVVLFSFLAYNQPSVVRASLMAVIGLVGLALYRDSNWLNTVSLAGLVILAFRPLYLFDVGWQLSFAGVYALVLFMPSFEPILPKRKKLMSSLWRYFLLIILGSLVVQLGVMPILIFHFHTVPLVSLIANVVVVPLVGTASGLGIVLIFVSGIPVVNAFVGHILALNVNLVMKSIDFFNNLSIPPIRIGAPEVLVVIMYYLILQILFLLFTKKKSVAFFVSLFIACLTILVWKEVIAGEKFDARITFLDTCDLNTTFVEHVKGSTILINGGGQEGGIDRGESVVLPFLLARGISRIDSLVATTESGNNRASMISAINGLGDVRSAGHNSISDSIELSRRIIRVNPIVLLKIDTLNIALLTQFSSVQDLHSLPSRLDVLAVDRSYLEFDELPKLLSAFQVGTLIITNYPKRFSSTRQIETVRGKFAQIPIFSVLESGGITIVILSGKAKVLPFSHS